MPATAARAQKDAPPQGAAAPPYTETAAAPALAGIAATTTSTPPIAVRAAQPVTAHDRFKQRAESFFWISIAIAALLHFLLFRYWPEMRAADISFAASELETVELPPEIEIPPPPEHVARPATPIVAEAAIEEDITIAPTTFEENPIENLPPPPVPGEDLSAAPVFTPYTVAPELLNRKETQAALQRSYPPVLRDAGIGGQVVVWFFIDETGRVKNARVHTSSGFEALDRAALGVAEIMRFSPAQNRDRRVPVWVALPVTFKPL
ncbi:MAG: TonB family protein [Gemmatimonadetes bacterium]|nr:TonB family protein [Gemmatimonadota bacterium]